MKFRAGDRIRRRRPDTTTTWASSPFSTLHWVPSLLETNKLATLTLEPLWTLLSEEFFHRHHIGWLQTWSQGHKRHTTFSHYKQGLVCLLYTVIVQSGNFVQLRHSFIHSVSPEQLVWRRMFFSYKALTTCSTAVLKGPYRLWANNLICICI